MFAGMIETEKRTLKFPKFTELIVHEDENLMVINKPPFLSSLDEREGGEPSVLRMAKQYHADAQVCHRIDKETSGLLLIAKNPETYRAVSIEFERRRVRKIYHAIINGSHAFTEVKVDYPILNLGNKNVTIDRVNGKPAETWFNSIEYYKHCTLVECRPVTGRMHQIRIHLATQHAAIVGDTLYKGKPIYLSQIKRGFTLGKDQEEQPIMKRFALHARELHFSIGDKAYDLEAPYPKDFATLLKQLQKFDK
ncbi:23S rRNA pseudouridine955/2504/2580 synthase [bacterium A37T11]|nr:23S rRNA pseudouridine955/2504/2580 synthase [bacterium A37T11]